MIEKGMEDPKSYDAFQEEAEDLYQNAPCGYLSALPDRTIIKINDVLLRWMGYSREEIVFKKKFTDLVTIGGKIYFETHHDPLQRMQGSVNELNYDLVRKDGSIFPCLINSAIKKDAHGNILLVRTTVFDITDRKKYEKELLWAKKEAQKAASSKAQLLSVMSHEIRTPMNAIIGMSHLLLDENPKPEQIEYLKILKLSSENLLHLLNNILDFSKIDAGKMSINFIDFALKDYLTGLVNTLKIKATEKGIILKLDYDDTIPSVLHSDPVKIGQILTNLIGNAIKFTEAGGVRVTVKLESLLKDDAKIAFTVKDSGVGIPKEKLSQIFNEYEQLGATLSQEIEGSGLGLSITKSLLEILGGNMQVSSEVGKGSTFSFELKIKVSDKVLIIDTHGNKGITPSLKGIKVLLAEDNSFNVLVITRFLKNWEVDFDIASNGKEALEKIKAHEYDVILMDLQMPEMTGYETTEKVRNLKEEKYQKLPIIAITASDIIGNNHRIYEIGMNDYVSKPFNPKDLYAKIFQYGHPKDCLEDFIDISLIETTVQSGSVLNFTKYELLADGDKTYLNALTKQTIHHFENYRREFKKALHANDLENYNKQVHKMKLVTDVLEIKNMSAALRTGAALLEKKEKHIPKFANAFDMLLQKVIGELKLKLKEAIFEDS